MDVDVGAGDDPVLAARGDLGQGDIMTFGGACKFNSITDILSQGGFFVSRWKGFQQWPSR